jgi:hypothetical protein
VATDIIYKFSGGGRLGLSGETISPASVGSRIAASLTATNVTAILSSILMFVDESVNISGVVTNAQGAVVLTFVPVQVSIGPVPPALPDNEYALVSLQTSGLVPAALAGQTLNVYLGPEADFTGAMVGSPYAGSSDVLTGRVTVGQAASPGSPGTFGRPPSPPTSTAPNKLIRALEIGGLAAGGLVVAAAWYNFEVHKVSANHETIVVGR